MKRLLMLPLLTLLSCGATAESKPFSGISIIGMQESTFNSVAVGVATTYLKDDVSLFASTSKPDSETRFGYDVGLKYAEREQHWYGGIGYNSSAEAMTMLVGFTL